MSDVIPFSDRGRRRPPIALPNGAYVGFTVDIVLEAFEHACQYRIRTPPDRPDLFSISVSDYGSRVGIWRLLEAADDFKIKTNLICNGLAAQRYPKTVRAVKDAGHDIVGHSWRNDGGILPTESEEGERAEVSRTLLAIQEAAGERPAGWLSSGFGTSHARRKVLAQEGIYFESDDARDDVPYVIDNQNKPYVIIPRVTVGMSDLENWYPPHKSPLGFFESYREQFDQIYLEGLRGRPGWIELIVHAHCGGRATFFAGVKRTIEYVLSKEGIWCATRREMADWMLAHPEYHG